MEETLEYRLTERLDVPSVPRRGEGPFEKIVMPGDIEDFELLRLYGKTARVTLEDIKREIADFYRGRKIPVSLKANGDTELIMNRGEIPRLGINLTHYGPNAKITVMRLTSEKTSEPQLPYTDCFAA